MSQISCPAVGPQRINAKQFVHRKPSMVVRAVIHGLQEASKRNDFILDMSRYGGTSPGNLCAGCMATVTMQSLFNVRFTTGNIAGYSQRARAVNADDSFDFHALEEAVDQLRCNRARPLFLFCGIRDEEIETKDLPTVVPIYAGAHKVSTCNCRGVVLSGSPSSGEVEVAIARLDKFAKLLEAKGV